MKYYSNGKLLLSGEYLVLKGAKALSVPVNFGQSLVTAINDQEGILWESYENSKPWFKAHFYDGLRKIKETTNEQTARFLLNLLENADSISKGAVSRLTNVKITTNVDFNMQWGLGSSSTLIANVAHLAGIDPFELHFAVSNGSGYDIACANSDGPVFYTLIDDRKYNIRKVNFNPDYSGNIFFVWTGKKKISTAAVDDFVRIKKRMRKEIEEISVLGENIAYAPQLEDFEYYLKEHELIISSLLKTKPVKQQFFGDYPGEVKSLGAWGGDFIMVTSDRPLDAVRKYFEDKGLDTVLTFEKMVKKWKH